MSKKLWIVSAGWLGIAMSALFAAQAGAQAADMKEKAPLYTYVADWQFPRAHWSEVDKVDAADSAVLAKALADGTLVGYGHDEAVLHQPDGSTHDNWWSSNSLAGLMKVLEQLSGTSGSPTLQTAAKHSDSIFVSHYYNWKSGSYKGAYTHISMYKLKSDAPNDAIETMSKIVVGPMLEKLLSDGVLSEYEIDTLAVHTSEPGAFWIAYVATNADGLDKVDAAIAATLKAHPMVGPAFGSWTDSNSHRDELVRGDGSYK